MASIVPDLLDLMPDTIGVETWLSQTSFGAATYGPLQERRGQAAGRVRQVRTSDGRLVTSTVQVILAGAFGVTVKDRYTLPARFVPNQPEALAVEHHTDEGGAHHETVYF